MITDSQVHIFAFKPGVPRDLNPEGHQKSHPNGFSIHELVAEMDKVGVDRAIICPPTVMMPDAAEYARQEMVAYPGRFAIIDKFEPMEPGARDQLAILNEDPRVHGIRLSPWTRPDYLEEGVIDWLWAECEKLGMPITVRIGQLSGKLLPIARKHPELRITVDHMGAVIRAKGEAAFGSVDQLLTLVPYPNVGVKMSAVPNNSLEPYPFRDLAAGIRRIYDGFGPRRMLWGSDISGLPCTYGECLRQFSESLDFLSAEDKEWILGKALAKFYDWPET